MMVPPSAPNPTVTDRWRSRGLTTLLLLLLLACLSFAPPRQAGATQNPTAMRVARWSRAFWIWRARAGEATPWQDDPRLRNSFTESGFPDDVQVIFPHPDSARGGRPEIMWVTVIAHDPSADQFLGILLNQPNALGNVVQFDNVAFRWDAKLRRPVAIEAGGSYAAAGWPRGALEDSIRSTFVRGVRFYRAGNNGHYMPGIESCIATLEPLANADWPLATRDDGYLLHFVTGRCLAEKYETLRAIRQFRRAVELAPDSLDAHMALLAEYSVIVHKSQRELLEGTEAEWERAYLKELTLIRTKFGASQLVTTILDWAFDERNAGDLSGLTPERIAKLKRVGYALIRWKQR